MTENISYPVSKIHLDTTNSLIFQDFRLKIFEAAQQTLQKILVACQLPKKHSSLGLEVTEMWNGPSYGLNLAMLPGLVVTLHHLLALALTADQLVTELELGLLQRQLSTKVPISLSIICQFSFHFCVILPQVCSNE